MNVTFPHLMEEFSISLNTVQWVTTGYLLTVAIVITVSSFMKQKFSERLLFLGGIAFFLIGDIICFTSTAFWQLMIGRVLQGVATGVSTPLLYNLILERVPMSRVGTYMGIGGLVMGIAPALGPTYGGLIVDILRWQDIYLIILPIIIIALIIGAISIENSERRPQEKSFDYSAFILLAVALSSSLFTLNALEHGSLNIPMTFVFVVSLALFIIRSLISKKAFLNIRIFGYKPLLFCFIAYSIYQFCMLGSNFIVPNYLEIGVGLSSSSAGFALFPASLIGAVSSPLFGKMYDRHGAKLPFYLGNAIFCVTLIILSLFTNALVFWNIAILYVFFIVGRTLPFNNIVSEALRNIGAEQRADGNAIFQMGQQFFGALGTTVAALIINNAPNITVGVQRNFSMMLVLTVIIFGLFVLLFRSERKSNDLTN